MIKCPSPPEEYARDQLLMIIEVLKQLAKYHTTSAVAAAAGVHTTTVSRLFADTNARKSPHYTTILKVAFALNLRLLWISGVAYGTRYSVPPIPVSRLRWGLPPEMLPQPMKDDDDDENPLQRIA